MHTPVLGTAHCKQHEEYLRHRRKIDAAALRFQVRKSADVLSWPPPLTDREQERIAHELSELLEPVLRSYLVDSEVTIGAIQLCVAGYYRKSLKEVLSLRRTKAIVVPRMVSMYLSKKLTGHSLPHIGLCHADRNHTTVLCAVRKIAQWVGDTSISQHPRTKPVPLDERLCTDIALIRQALGQ